MTNPMIKIHNAETGEIVEREMDANELAQYKQGQEEEKANEAKRTEADTAKSAAQAKLAALGLTADDLKALGLGGN